MKFSCHLHSRPGIYLHSRPLPYPKPGTRHSMLGTNVPCSRAAPTPPWPARCASGALLSNQDTDPVFTSVFHPVDRVHMDEYLPVFGATNDTTVRGAPKRPLGQVNTVGPVGSEEVTLLEQTRTHLSKMVPPSSQG